MVNYHDSLIEEDHSRSFDPRLSILNSIKDASLRADIASRFAVNWFSKESYLILKTVYRLSHTEILIFVVKYGNLNRCTDSPDTLECLSEKIGVASNTIRTHITHILHKLDFAGCRDPNFIYHWARESQIFNY